MVVILFHQQTGVHGILIKLVFFKIQSSPLFFSRKALLKEQSNVKNRTKGFDDYFLHKIEKMQKHMINW